MGRREALARAPLAVCAVAGLLVVGTRWEGATSLVDGDFTVWRVAVQLDEASIRLRSSSNAQRSSETPLTSSRSTSQLCPTFIFRRLPSA